jgi:hypothetical protein
MGTRFEFNCRACGYSAMVSGGPDVGMTVRTVTIACDTCKKLRDAVVEEFGAVVGGSESGGPPPAPPGSPQCPGSRTRVHKTRLWTAPGPCPRCGAGPMTPGQSFVDWD